MNLEGNGLDNSSNQESTNGEKETAPLVEHISVNLPQGTGSQNLRGDQSGPGNVANAQNAISQVTQPEEAILARIGNRTMT